MKNALIYLAAATMLIGCASDGIADYRGLGINSDRVTEPLASNDYKGVLVEKSPVTAAALAARAAEICSAKGGLKMNPQYTNSVPLGWKLYEFRCNGFPETRIPDKSSYTVTRPQANIPTTQTIDDLKSTIQDAKTECIELGFKANTESFGKCVLKLSN